MKISHRLYVAVTPAIVGLLLMAALFYWGRYEHTAPAAVLVVGAIAVVASLALVWTNARFVARRIEQLAQMIPTSDISSAPDELERIAQGFDRLSSDVQIAAADRVNRERVLEERLRDYAQLLADIATDTAKELENVRLPLHILLENHFGDLNENQEEMLGAARAAAEAVDADLVSLRDIAELDLGNTPLRRDRMKASDIVDALRPMLVAAAESAEAAIEVEVAPFLPAFLGDRARLQIALATLLGNAVHSATTGASVRMTVEQRASVLSFDVTGIGMLPASVRAAAAMRVVRAHHGEVARGAGCLAITLPIETRGMVADTERP